MILTSKILSVKRAFPPISIHFPSSGAKTGVYRSTFTPELEENDNAFHPFRLKSKPVAED
jgi:hypothetical protein